MKKVAMTAARPRVVAPVDDWISNRLGQDNENPAPAGPEPEAPREPSIRLTFDIPKSMHKRLKLGATERDTTIADVIRDLIAKEFPAP
jgi:hypothetical protein